MLLAKKIWRIRVLLFFRSLSKTPWHFPRNCWGSTHRTAFYVPRRKLWMILFVGKNFFIVLIGGSAKKIVNCVKKVGSFLKTALYLSRSLSSTFSSNVLWILKVTEFERNFFGLIGKTFSYRSRFLLEQKCFTEKNIYCQFFVHFG